MEFEEFNWDGISKATGITTNREAASIIKNQQPLVLAADETVQRACQSMSERRCGSVLVVDKQKRLTGIFTGRDAVRLLADGKDVAEKSLGLAMKRDPVTITLKSHAIDALRAMSDGGFRHLPVVENGKIYGVVSRGDFTGIEIDRLNEEGHLAECSETAPGALQHTRSINVRVAGVAMKTYVLNRLLGVKGGLGRTGVRTSALLEKA